MYKLKNLIQFTQEFRFHLWSFFLRLHKIYWLSSGEYKILLTFIQILYYILLYVFTGSRFALNNTSWFYQQ